MSRHGPLAISPHAGTAIQFSVTPYALRSAVSGQHGGVGLPTIWHQLQCHRVFRPQVYIRARLANRATEVAAGSPRISCPPPTRPASPGRPRPGTARGRVPGHLDHPQGRRAPAPGHDQPPYGQADPAGRADRSGNPGNRARHRPGRQHVRPGPAAAGSAGPHCRAAADTHRVIVRPRNLRPLRRLLSPPPSRNASAWH